MAMQPEPRRFFGTPPFRRRLVALGLLGLASAAWAARRSAPFLVEVVRLAECPERLREPMARVLRGCLGRSYFDVKAEREVLRARLCRHPEVADAEVACRAPRTVEVRIRARKPVVCVRGTRGWLWVDGVGQVVRAEPVPAAGLVQVYGFDPGTSLPGAVLCGVQLAEADQVSRACERVLGARPRVVIFEPGGGTQVRTAAGDLVVLGRARDLDYKMQVFLVVHNRLTRPAAYVDVSVPSVPVWLPGG